MPGWQTDWAVRLLAAGLVLLILLSGCTPAATELPPTPTSTLTPTTTPTVVWFPATATPSPQPTPQPSPTSEVRPALGEVIFSDGFTSAGDWPVGSLPAGNIALGDRRLTLAISQAGGTLSALRGQPALQNGYIEITATPSLCRSADQYGLLFRAASVMDTYRLLLRCDGQLRLERLNNGRIKILQDWLPSADVPQGAPGTARIGIWMQGAEIKIFVNDAFQFSVTDDGFSSGQMGLFARSGSDTAVSIAFSGLTVWELAP